MSGDLTQQKMKGEGKNEYNECNNTKLGSDSPAPLDGNGSSVVQDQWPSHWTDTKKQPNINFGAGVRLAQLKNRNKIFK